MAIAGGRRIDPHTIHVAGVADDATEFWLTEIAFYLADGTLFAVAVFPDRPLSYKAADTKHLFGFDLLLTALPANSVTIIAGAPDINLSVASDLAALAKAGQKEAAATVLRGLIEQNAHFTSRDAAQSLLDSLK